MHNKPGRIRAHVEATKKNLPAHELRSYTTRARVFNMEKQVLMNTMYFLDYNYYEIAHRVESRGRSEEGAGALRAKRNLLREAEQKIAEQPNKKALARLRDEVGDLQRRLREHERGKRVAIDLRELIERAAASGGCDPGQFQGTAPPRPDASGLDVKPSPVEVDLVNTGIPAITDQELRVAKAIAELG